MTPPRKVLLLCLSFLMSLTLSGWAGAQSEARISDLSYFDRQYMQQQRDLLNDLAARQFGRPFTGDRHRDLELLQRLLDNGLVRDDQTSELQAMGIVMGDLLASELNLDWVIYEDRLGRTRALRYKTSDKYLFPITMISKRREVGSHTPVADIYSKAGDTLRAAIPALPFQ